MNLGIGVPKAIHEVGGRDNNEDSIWPLLGQASDQDTLFLVCDGVGGNKRGEVASQLVVEGFAHFFDQHSAEDSISQATLQAALKAVEVQLSAYLQTHPASKGMATTLTLLCLSDHMATIAWIGDSKVYHFREGTILYETEDHSLVNQLIREGIISPEEAATHPHRNVITRAIKGREEATEMDVHQISDIQSGDLFLLCSDGITENWSSEELAKLSQAHEDLDQMKSAILSKSRGRTDDNFSAYLVQITNKETDTIPVATVVEAEKSDSFPSNSARFSQILKPVGLALLGIVSILVLFVIFRSGHPDIDIRHKAEDALTKGEYVEAMYWADSLQSVTPEDKALKKKFEHLQDSVKERLLLWMNDSAESSTRLLGCQKLNGSVDTFRSKSLTRLLQQCERKLGKADAVDWMDEGEVWWQEEDFLKANICFIEAKSVQEAEGDSVTIALAMILLETAKSGISKGEKKPLKVLRTLERVHEYVEKDKCSLALKQYEKVAESLLTWKLDSLVNELIGIQTCQLGS